MSLYYKIKDRKLFAKFLLLDFVKKLLKRRKYLRAYSNHLTSLKRHNYIL